MSSLFRKGCLARRFLRAFFVGKSLKSFNSIRRDPISSWKWATIKYSLKPREKIAFSNRENGCAQVSEVRRVVRSRSWFPAGIFEFDSCRASKPSKHHLSTKAKRKITEKKKMKLSRRTIRVSWLQIMSGKCHKIITVKFSHPGEPF